VAENSSHLINSRYAMIVITYSQLMQQRRRNKEKVENKKEKKSTINTFAHSE